MPLPNQLDILLRDHKALLAGHHLQAVVIEETLATRVLECLESVGAPRRVTLISDNNTHAALGARIEQEIKSSIEVNTLIFQESPPADIAHASQVQEAASNSDMILAVGSGTLNDICKYASFLGGKPYTIFPTAPSMNGYLSATASLLKTGHRHSFPAHLPVALFCDLDVLAKAPQRLIRSGFGDVMCRTTAQADWLISHLLLETLYDPLPFELLKPHETKLIKQAQKLAEGDKETISLLLKSLLVSGLGMVIAKGSYPASQGEHLIAHCMDMMLPRDATTSYHGEQVAVATMTMAAIQDTFLAYVPAMLKDKDPILEIESYFGPSLQVSVKEEYIAKQLPPDKLTLANNRIRGEWATIAAKVRAVRIPADKLRTILKNAGCPTHPEDIGWNTADYEKAVRHAHFIRDRFTFLDIAYLSR